MRQRGRAGSAIPWWMMVISDRAVPCCAGDTCLLGSRNWRLTSLSSTSVGSRPCVTGFWGALEKEVPSPSAGQLTARGGTRLCGDVLPSAPAGLSRAPSPRHTGTKQVAEKWCHCVMSNPCIIKILFEQMSQEASGPVSQAGAAKFFWPSVTELSVSVWLALAGVAVMGWVLRAVLCPRCPQGPAKPC